MMTEKEIMDKLRQIAVEVQEIEPGRMNSLLSPEPIKCDPETQTAEIRYEAKDWERNHRGELHGGAVAAMFDTSMGMSLLAFTDHYSVATADLSVSYIRPFMGGSFIFEVNVIRAGRSMARLRAVAKDEDTGKILASATSNFVYADK